MYCPSAKLDAYSMQISMHAFNVPAHIRSHQHVREQIKIEYKHNQVEANPPELIQKTLMPYTVQCCFDQFDLMGAVWFRFSFSLDFMGSGPYRYTHGYMNEYVHRCIHGRPQIRPSLWVWMYDLHSFMDLFMNVWNHMCSKHMRWSISLAAPPLPFPSSLTWSELRQLKCRQ